MCMYVSLQVHAHMNVDADRDERVHFSVELELQATVGDPTRLLWTELPSSARAVHNLNCRAISLPPPSPPPYFQVSISRWTWSSLTWLNWLASKPPVSSCLHLPALGLQGCTPHPAFMWVSEDPNSCLPTSLAGPLPTEPSPQIPVPVLQLSAFLWTTDGCAIPTHLQPCQQASLSLCSSVTQALVTCSLDFRLSSAVCLVFLLLMACVFTAIS